MPEGPEYEGDYTYAQVYREFKSKKMKCPHCKKKCKLKSTLSEGKTQLALEDFNEPGILWMNVPYYMCPHCKQGVYDIRAHIMESVAIMWANEDNEEQTMH